jgi:uncharacterized membrane protein YphA (DoxX/SURF4 family)
MAIATVLAASILPLALGGESAGETGMNSTLIDILSAVSIVGGYLLIFALWRWVFSARARDRRRNGSSG